MKKHNHKDARCKILELCSEDDFGVWELYGSVTPYFGEKIENQESATIFIQVIKDLIGQGAIVPKRQNRSTGGLEPVVLDEKELVRQLTITAPDVESFYWFGLK
jgi:hypothetical protein